MSIYYSQSVCIQNNCVKVKTHKNTNEDFVKEKKSKHIDFKDLFSFSFSAVFLRLDFLG